MKFRGQVSVETIVAVFILFFVLVIFFSYTILLNTSAQNIDKSFSEKNDCLKLMYSMSQMNTEGVGSEMTFYFDHDFNIYSTQKSIQIGEQYCFFLARTNDYQLNSGEIKLKNVNGIIEVEQV